MTPGSRYSLPRHYTIYIKKILLLRALKLIRKKDPLYIYFTIVAKSNSLSA